MASNAVELYRHCLRTVRAFPKPVQSKIKANIRELIEVHRGEKDPAVIRALIEQGERDMESLQLLMTARMETLTMLMAESNLSRGVARQPPPASDQA